MTVLDEDKLSVYNGALRRLGSRQLASLTENREPRRVLDGAWGDNDAPRKMLEQSGWNFATRTVEGIYAPEIEPPFGFRRAFNKPTDFVRLTAMSGDDSFSRPLVHSEYVDEAGYWFTERDVLYVKYVSDSDDYGMKSAVWNESFKELLELLLAHETCERLTNSRTKKMDLWGEYHHALKVARSQDGMNDGVKFLPSGGWVRSRSQRRDS